MDEFVFECEKLKDFNQVFEWYAQNLVSIKSMKPMGQFTIYRNPIESTFGRDRAMLNNIGVNIAQNFEYIEKNHADNINELILKELRFGSEGYEQDERMICIDNFELAFKKIMKDNNLTPFETLKQIRNALLHGNYMMKNKADINNVVVTTYPEDDFRDKMVQVAGEKFIQLHSAKMDGVLPYNETVALADTLFYNIRYRCTKGKREFTQGDGRFISCANEFFLRKYINSIQSYYIVPKGTNEQGNMEELIAKFPSIKEALKNMNEVDGTNFFEIEKVPEEQMQQRRKDIETYIRYIGKKNWKYTWMNGIHEEVYENIFLSRFNETITTISLANVFGRAMEQVSQSTFMDVPMNNPELTNSELEKLSFETPLIFSDMVLGLLNYGCGYLKANNAEANTVFEYHNIQGMERIAPSIDNDKTPSIQYGMSGAEKQRKLDLAIEGYQRQLVNVKKDINKANELLENLNKNNTKHKKQKELRKHLEEYTAKKYELIGQVLKLTMRRIEYNEDYTDYSELFRHLRNSIAHGRYQIEYNDALQANILERIKFTFYDYNENNIDEKNPDFKIEMYAGQIIRAMNGLLFRVNAQVARENQMDKIDRTRASEILNAVANHVKNEKNNKDHDDDER